MQSCGAGQVLAAKFPISEDKSGNLPATRHREGDVYFGHMDGHLSCTQKAGKNAQASNRSPHGYECHSGRAVASIRGPMVRRLYDWKARHHAGNASSSSAIMVALANLLILPITCALAGS